MNILRFNKVAVFSLLMLGSSAAIAQKGSTADEPVSGSGVRPVTDKWRPTLKDGTDDSYIRVKHIGFPIPWQSIREADVLWKKRVWREIDTREKQNIAFRYEGDESTGGGMFIEILVDAVKRGLITAYSAMDADGDRFHTALSKEQFIEKITPKPDTIEAEELDGTIVKKIVQRDFEPAKVTVYRVKEDWIFDRNQGKMVVRIVGIAPIMDYYDENNQFKGSSPLFWLSYPESRTLFSSYEVFNPNNDISRPTWDEFFENRHFSSRITKVTNALNQRYEDVFGTDARGKMEALYESQQQVNDIFNKEHDMWIY